ncbi:MAG TPA: alpha-amylase family glycosyl hydrolase [Gaiellaceae bacterium]|nr:alpha-amylase family glycosyl hydrolase [Gaiellaceae bacterium]
MGRAWWRDGIFYQIYPRSFADADGDGVGDLAGLTASLDYLEWLGVTAVWLNPINPSPNVDWGYDVADYTDVHPDLGSLEDVDRLVAEAGRRGIRVLLDLVPNHTSDQHPWFRERPDFYVWADTVPNNWQAIFGGGPAWALDETRGRYFLHNFAKEQPDLDWWNPEVRTEFQRILRFWFDRGIAGFRIDVAHGLVKDSLLRDDVGDVRIHSMNRPETHEIYRDWRRLADSYEPPRALLGEVYVLDVPAWAGYYGTGSDELHLAFNFALVHADLQAEQLRTIVADTEAALPPGAWPCWIGSNHDVGRFTTRWCGGDEALARCALLMLLTLRGTPSLYYGDELALPEGHVPRSRVRDVATPSRDPCRTPMPWTRQGGWHDPWLPLEDTSRNVEDQRADPGSTLHFTRTLIALRAQLSDLSSGAYAELPAPTGTWAWRRGRSVVVAINLAADETAIGGIDGSIALSTRRGREGERVAGSLRLAPSEGAIVTSAGNHR